MMPHHEMGVQKLVTLITVSRSHPCWRTLYWQRFAENQLHRVALVGRCDSALGNRLQIPPATRELVEPHRPWRVVITPLTGGILKPGLHRGREMGHWSGQPRTQPLDVVSRVGKHGIGRGKPVFVERLRCQRISTEQPDRDSGTRGPGISSRRQDLITRAITRLLDVQTN